MHEPLSIALLGLGTVGTGVARVLTQHEQRIARQADRPIRIKHVVVREIGKSRDVALNAGALTNKFEHALRDPDVGIVVELMGGIEPARTVVLDALRHGKHIVTANKALLAEHGHELFEAARKAQRVDCLRSGSCWRGSRDRRFRAIPDGEPGPIDQRHPERHIQLYCD